MPQPIVALSWPNPYGPIPANYAFNLNNGYTALVGKNDVGKTAFLQWIFCRMMQQVTPGPSDAIALILTDRFYVASNTRTTQTLQQYNGQFHSAFNGAPKPFHNENGPAPADLFAALLQRTDMTQQNLSLNDLLGRAGFPPLVIRGQQEATVGGRGIHTHGSGLRCLLPVLVALTSVDINYVLIDEPELSLEARAQKVVRQLLVEAVEKGKTIVASTQSHLFLNRTPGQLEHNVRVSDEGSTFSLRPVTSSDGLLDLTYNLLGNSLEDLFFPGNFLIVEGASDQCIAERVASLLSIPSTTAKVISAKGIDNVDASYQAINNTLIPLITSGSPYAQRVVALIDKPESDNDKRLKSLRSTLGERCLLLDAPSLEEYLPAELYTRAGRDKGNDLTAIEELRSAAKHNADGKRKLGDLKRAISEAISQQLTVNDRKLIPRFFEAVERAATS
jgi:hypothetical protein